MENRDFVKEGVTRLLPGLRFQPTDEELVFEYLRCKVFSFPLPASVIPEVQFFKLDPWKFPGHPDEARYFFSKKERKSRNGSRTNRATRSGYWKATNSGKQISPPPTLNLGMEMKGLKKTFVFHEGKGPNGCRTNWFMHEYSLHFNVTSSNDHVMNSFAHQGHEVTFRGEEWVICHVSLRQRIEDEDCEASVLDQCSDNFSINANTLRVHDTGYLNPLYDCSPSVSSSSSGYQVSPYQPEYEEEISYTPTFK